MFWAYAVGYAMFLIGMAWMVLEVVTIRRRRRLRSHLEAAESALDAIEPEKPFGPWSITGTNETRAHHPSSHHHRQLGYRWPRTLASDGIGGKKSS